MPTLWVKNKAQSIKAKKVISDFEEEWRANERNNKTSSRPPKEIRFRITIFITTLIISFLYSVLFYKTLTGRSSGTDKP